MRNVVEGYFKCKFKSHLYFIGEKGIRTDYEELIIETRAQLKLKTIHRLAQSNSESAFACDVTLTHKLLQQGAEYIFNGTASYSNLSLLFDGLKKVGSSSKITKNHYIPILISETENLDSDDKHLLSLYGLVLSDIQSATVREGLFIHGRTLKNTVVKINPSDRITSRILQEINDIQNNTYLPQLILNNHCQVCEFRHRCIQQATSEDNLSLLHGMTEKQIAKYNRRGILTVSQLSYIYRARRKPTRDITPHHDFTLQALALRDGRVIIKESPSLVREPVSIYLDIEGLPERHFEYLVGALICTHNSETYYPFWANDQSQETEIFTSFLNMLRAFDKFHIFHYGAYEINFIKRIREKIPEDPIIDKILCNSTNVLSKIYGRLYFPTFSNSLKHLARLLGFAWSDEQASGINSIVWRHDWEKTNKKDAKERIITYNKDDCAALKVITNFIYSISDKSHLSNVIEKGNSSLEVSYICDIHPKFNRPDWGKVEFATADFEFINTRSYFDYQREKIYIRTNENIALQHEKNIRPPRRIKATKQTELTCSSCPTCGCSDIIKIMKVGGGIGRRKCLDLEITDEYVKRVVDEFSSYEYRCNKCNKEFYAEQYTKMHKYGHSLKSWAMYEYVAHRMSLKSLEGTFRELFNLPVCFRHIHVIKRITANYYSATIEGIRRSLVAGSIIHADETQIHFQKGKKGYVWTFTNLEEVFFVYTESREGSFLKDLFAGFSGVLISDFYAVYDWPNCAQQKCLIHLIRDLNGELLKNPFDEEYKNIVAEFGFLLRNIIATVDEYGLKRRYLKKHLPEVSKYMFSLEKKCYRSVIAQSVQERIIKNKDKLFTFLRYDGVPWNNNNAEHAIKRFAHYREITDGHLTANGLADYLVLLSIGQTCEYKGISFLKFLLSGETDICNYIEQSGKNVHTEKSDASLLEQTFFNRNLRNHNFIAQYAEESDKDMLGNDDDKFNLVTGDRVPNTNSEDVLTKPTQTDLTTTLIPLKAELFGKNKHRVFSTEYKLDILRKIELCKVPGSKGALLRKEGLYSPQLTTWRRQLHEGKLTGKKQEQPNPFAHEIERLRKENSQLAKLLSHAEFTIAAQKKYLPDPAGLDQ